MPEFWAANTNADLRIASSNSLALLIPINPGNLYLTKFRILLPFDSYQVVGPFFTIVCDQNVDNEGVLLERTSINIYIIKLLTDLINQVIGTRACGITRLPYVNRDQCRSRS